MLAQHAIAPDSPDEQRCKILFLSDSRNENRASEKLELEAQLKSLKLNHLNSQLIEVKNFFEAVDYLHENHDIAIFLIALSPIKNTLQELRQQLDNSEHADMCVIAIIDDPDSRQRLLNDMSIDQIVTGFASELLLPALVSGLKYHQKIRQIQSSQKILNAVYQVNEVSTGDAYLRDIAENLASLMGVKYILIGEAGVPDDSQITTRVVWSAHHFAKNFSYAKAGTPCNEVICGQRVIAYKNNVIERFPDDLILKDMGVESYMGAAISSPAGELIGLIAAMDTKPMENTNIYKPVFDFLASRAGIEFERQQAEDRLNIINEELEAKVELRTRELQATHKELLQLAHQAGMADIAAGVLHNVGNVFNSIGVACQVMKADFAQSKLSRLSDTASLLESHKDQLAHFITADEKGKQLPDYIFQLNKVLEEEVIKHEENLQSILDNGALIQDVIRNQLDYAKLSTLEEKCDPKNLVDKALMLQLKVMEKYQINIEKNYDDVPMVYLQEHKFMHVLINIFKNAHEAMKETQLNARKLIIDIRETSVDGVQIIITDNGPGISEDKIQKIFSLGFSTKDNGHGIGLHVSSNYMQEMGGSLSVASNGPQAGASFTLSLPIKKQAL